MRLILIILTLMTITNCSSQTENTDDVKSNYSNWRKSFVKSVINEKNLLDYQRENLIEISKNISLSNFIKLRQLLLNAHNNQKIDNEYYLLELSEGEVVTAYLYYVIESNKQYQLAFMNIYEENEEVIKLNKSDSDIKKLIKVKPINDETLNDKLFVLTIISKNKISSIIGSEE
jgi:hypothetical protein